MSVAAEGTESGAGRIWEYSHPNGSIPDLPAGEEVIILSYEAERRPVKPDHKSFVGGKMEDITPLNLEDQPKLFGMRYDQLIAILASLIVSTEFYSWVCPIPIFGGHDLRLDIAILLFLFGPIYCLVTYNNSIGNWEGILNHYFASQIYIPGPDPNPTRFLVDETLVEFSE